MDSREWLCRELTDLEIRTASDAFGGEALIGRAPSYGFSEVILKFADQHPGILASRLNELRSLLSAQEFKQILTSLARFAFLIELTNLRITSTKMKTRWFPGVIIKTLPGSFQNIRGSFSPQQDERASTFDQCFDIFCRCLDLLLQNPSHLEVQRGLVRYRSVAYENVFTYIDSSLEHVHFVNNIRLAALNDIYWLQKVRPLMNEALPLHLIKKVQTKSYLTDRSQTGEVQTNRAKRWECTNLDFQRASIEECWSVERKLLSDIANFEGFPTRYREYLISENLIFSGQYAVCPITFQRLQFSELIGQGSHGESRFQVGHMEPLKAGGRHVGHNISWISSDGNRIQGSMSVQETHQMIINIYNRMHTR